MDKYTINDIEINDIIVFHYSDDFEEFKVLEVTEDYIKIKKLNGLDSSGKYYKKNQIKALNLVKKGKNQLTFCESICQFFNIYLFNNKALLTLLILLLLLLF